MLPKELTNLTAPARHRLWAELAGDSAITSLRAMTLGWIPAKEERMNERRTVHAISLLRTGSSGTLRGGDATEAVAVRGPGVFFATPGVHDDYGPRRPGERWRECYWILDGARLAEWREAGWWDATDRFWPLTEAQERCWWAMFVRWVEALQRRDRKSIDACKLELERRLSNGPWTKRPKPMSQSPCLAAVALWRRDLARDWSLSETAAAVGLSYTRFRARFVTELGESPHQHLERLRLEMASHWLRSTSEPVKSIAWRCGYQRVETFIRAFQRRHGRSPGEHRGGGKTP